MNQVAATVRPSQAPAPRRADAFRDAVRALVEGPSASARRHNPRRYAYLRQALMAREMGRL